MPSTKTCPVRSESTVFALDIRIFILTEYAVNEIDGCEITRYNKSDSCIKV